MLRYQSTGELHKDFHSSTNMTLDYIAGKYGVDALKMILRRTGKNVYKSIHDKLARGGPFHRHKTVHINALRCLQ